MKNSLLALALMLLIYSPSGKVYIFNDKGITIAPNTTGGFVVKDADGKTLGFFSSGWACTNSDFHPLGEVDPVNGKLLKDGKI